MKHSKKIGVSIFILFILAAFTYALDAGFDESRWFKRNSIDYFLLVHDEYINDFPLPKNLIDEKFNTSCGDGPKQPYTAVLIQAKSIDQAYMQEIEQFIKRKKLIQSDEDGIYSGSKVFKNQDGDDIELAIRQEESKVSISFEHRSHF